MGCAASLALLAAVFVLVGPWVLAVWAWRRQGVNRGRLDEIELDLGSVAARLSGRLEEIERKLSDGAGSASSEAPVLPREGPATSPVEPAAAPLASEPPGPPPEPSPPSELPEAPKELPEPPEPRQEAPQPLGDSSPIRTIEWERWIGVRGAAVLGAVVLALAGILFLRYSIERGLIPPPVRVAFGIFAGIACILGSERLRRRHYVINANALAGAGVVLLYAALWAARALYEMIGAGTGFALMVLVTAACGALSWRYGSLLIAVLGLIGGFSTPLLMSSASPNPIGLFGYILLLDLGLLVLAGRRGWSVLFPLALVGTVLYQVLWTSSSMGPERAILGLVIVGAFGLLFGLAGLMKSKRDDVGAGGATVWRSSETAGLLFSFALGLNFAARAELGLHLYPIGALLVVLSAAAQWIGRAHGTQLLSLAAAAADIAVLSVWAWRSQWTVPLAWELVLVSVALALVFHVGFEADLRKSRVGDGVGRAFELAPLVASAGLFVLVVFFSLASNIVLWPWLAGVAALATLLVRHSRVPGRAPLQAVAAVGFATTCAAFYVLEKTSSFFPHPALFFAMAAAGGLVFQVLPVVLRGQRVRYWGNVGGALCAGILLLSLVPDSGSSLPAPAFLGLSLFFGLLVTLSVTRMPSAVGYLLAMALVASVHTLWAADEPAAGTALLGLIVVVVAAAFFTFWPSFVAGHFESRALVWKVSALAGPAWFFVAKDLFLLRFGGSAIGVVPLVLGALSLSAAFRGHTLWSRDESLLTSNLAWYSAVALGFVSVAVPLQLDREWITLGWALEAAAVTALWRRLDHAGLKYFALALLAAVSVRLIANPALLGYHERSGWPVLNWLAYTYLVPVAALLVVAYLLRGVEIERARRWEDALYRRGHSWWSSTCGLAAILLTFVWINLTIVDAFSSGPRLGLSLDRLPARDLTLSLAWVVYALVLLALGVIKDAGAMRWLSLGFLVLSIGKVFLYDLGELRDLYLVASLVGLAFSLIGVSLAYQRFVFRRSVGGEDSA